MKSVDELLVSSSTKRLLNGYLKNPNHALLLVGGDGSGAELIAKMLAMKLLGLESIIQLANSSQVMRISPNENGNISIDEIREAWRYSRVPASTADGKTKIVMVSNAQALTREAQSSFLKLLEEPPEYMLFILSVTSEKLLLSTVESRVQTIHLKPPTDEHMINALCEKYDKSKTEARQAWLMSGGEPYVAAEIIEQGGSEGLDFAKRMLSLSSYDRIIESKDLLKDRDKALRLTQDITRLAYLATTTSVKSGKDSRDWLRRLKLSQDTSNNLRANANVRLNMINLFSSL